MRRRSRRALSTSAAGVLITLAAAFSPASAQPRPLGALDGAWKVETKPHQTSGCVIRGDATVTSAANGRLSVRLDVVQTCPADTGYWARESCEGAAHGANVTLTCTVLSSETGNYRPDSFTLTRAGADLMTGRLVDTGVWNTEVVWRRAGAPLVS